MRMSKDALVGIIAGVVIAQLVIYHTLGRFQPLNAVGSFIGAIVLVLLTEWAMNRRRRRK